MGIASTLAHTPKGSDQHNSYATPIFDLAPFCLAECHLYLCILNIKNLNTSLA